MIVIPSCGLLGRPPCSGGLGGQTLAGHGWRRSCLV